MRWRVESIPLFHRCNSKGDGSLAGVMTLGCNPMQLKAECGIWGAGLVTLAWSPADCSQRGGDSRYVIKASRHSPLSPLIYLGASSEIQKPPIRPRSSAVAWKGGIYTTPAYKVYEPHWQWTPYLSPTLPISPEESSSFHCRLPREPPGDSPTVLLS